MKKKLVKGICLMVSGLGLVLMTMAPALADQIVVCQSCTSAPGGDPNIITDPSSFNMFIEGNGKVDVAPTLIIIATYNAGAQPTVTVNGGAGLSLAGLGTLGLGANGAALTAPPSNDVMDVLGLTGGGSLNFGNLSDADVAHGLVAPTSFTLYAFQFDGPITSFPSLTVGVTGAVSGSFVFGYACQSTPEDTTCDHGDVSQSVMTNGGLINGVSTPEPGSLLLLGMSLAGIGVWMWRKQRNVQG